MSQASRLKNHGHVQLRTKKENATTAENAGIKKFKLLYMENTKMHEFKHPNYYKELRKRNKTGVTVATKRDIGHSQELSFGFPPPVNSDQAISDEASTEATSVRPGPGLKLQAQCDSQEALQSQSRASSDKQQASSDKP